MSRTINLGKVTGEQGPQGETGPQGPQGPQGAKGEKGDPGSSVCDDHLDETSENPVQNKVIAALVPAQAASDNRLADKNFVNSSIATNTAYFKGTFDSLEELEAVENPTNNDYGFVVSTDSAGNTVYNRYKYNGTAWAFEYALNNSSFTAEQWAAIQSGITAALVAKLNGVAAGAQVNVVESVKQNGTAVTPDGKSVDILAPKGTDETADDANINEIRVVAAMPAEPVPTTLYLIKETV